MLLPECENLTVEFKADPPSGSLSDHKIRDAVVAMANTQGGNIYIGIDDNGEITGLRHDPQNKWLDEVKTRHFIFSNTVPCVIVDVEILSIDKKNICKISVPKSNCIVHTKDGKMLRRVLKKDRTPENIPFYSFDVLSHLADSAYSDVTATVLNNCTEDDLDVTELMRLRSLLAKNQDLQNLNELDDQDLDKALGLIRTNELGQMHPTIAGLLLIGKEEPLQRIIPGNRTFFQMILSGTVVVNDYLTGPVLKVIEEVMLRFKAHNKQTEIMLGAQRIGIPDYDEQAFREAFINALCHRDYAIPNEVIVNISDNQINISSPGGFINSIDIKHILTAPPFGRNKLLADIFNRIGLAERTGRGIDRIFAGSALYGKIWPTYENSNNDHVTVEIFKRGLDLEFYTNVKQTEKKLEHRISIESLLILSALRKHDLSISELAELTGYSKNSLISEIEMLCEIEVATKSQESEKYTLTPNFSQSNINAHVQENKTPLSNTNNSLKNQTTSDRILSFMQESNKQEITRADICQLFGCSKSSAYLYLNRLVEKKILQATGEKRGRKYVRI